ncbi:sulfotransferase family 2 domain-containing protein [Pseudodesulfovibrio senegalensis]|uniref:Sulfotransferase family protein n=1 Tax=Pseudodesulfovibrio senegalensis TaxID=1721087 RepID=A0A6N6N1G0_9BACT|nr:sulfotransferase family 2 domain-containing protein [Pseudodesulfovibrio senegalensis]KAB1441441.1 sulfotransferase family protein [Pseudodesulfovibrio senegalensis]
MSEAGIFGLPAFVYHHLPKTAGSTFRTVMESYWEPEAVCRFEVEDEFAGRDESWRAARFFAGHFSYGFVRDFPLDVQRVVFLRNPVERVVSQYYNFHDASRRPQHWDDRTREHPEMRLLLDAVRTMSLSDFIGSREPFIQNVVRNYQTRYLTDHSTDPARMLPQDCVLEDSPHMLEEAKGNLLHSFDFFGVQELFGMSMNLFCAQYGLPPLGTFGAMTRNINPRKHGLGRYELSEAVLERLHALNSLDMELWRFAQNVLLERVEQSVRSLTASRSREKTVAPDVPCCSWPVVFPVETLKRFRGLYWLEEDGLGRKFRWTGYETPAVLELEFPVNGNDALMIALDILSDAPPEKFTAPSLAFDSLECRLLRADRVGPMQYSVKYSVTVADYHWPRRIHLLKVNEHLFTEPYKAAGRLLGSCVHRVAVDRVV